jgi:hypothetical protein
VLTTDKDFAHLDPHMVQVEWVDLQGASLK